MFYVLLYIEISSLAYMLKMLESFSEYANFSVQSLLNDLKIGIMSLSFDEKKWI